MAQTAVILIRVPLHLAIGIVGLIVFGHGLNQARRLQRMKTLHVATILWGVLNVAFLHAQTGTTGDSRAPQLGSLKGRFLYDGDPPKAAGPSRFDAIRLNTPVSRDSVGRVSGVEFAYREYLQTGIRPKTGDNSLLVNKDGGIANVVVFATSMNITDTAVKVPKAKPAVLQIKDGQFTPRVLAVATNQPLQIENSDAFRFNFHLQTIQNQPVNLLLAPESKKELTFSNREKIPLPFRSDHQIWATGFILIHDNPYSAVSSTDGSFTFTDLPLGKWEFQAWHEKAGYLQHWPKGRFTVEIHAGNNELGNVKLSPDLFTK